MSLPNNEFISPHHHSKRKKADSNSYPGISAYSPDSFFPHSNLSFESNFKDFQRPEVEGGLLRKFAFLMLFAYVYLM